MRVIFLAAMMVCVSWLSAKAQPSKMQPVPNGLVEPVALTPASDPISDLNADAAEAEPIDGVNARSTEIDVKAAPVASRSVADAKLAKVKAQRSRIEPLKVTNVKLTAIDGAASAATETGRPDQPSKMNPDTGGGALTGALRDVQMYAGASPWLQHALDDVGTNPTGWKRLWCAKSLNMWLERSGKRGCGGNTAVSCLNAGRKLAGPQVGAIAVMKHHVGIVKEVHGKHVTLVSGNNSGRAGARKVGVSKYARGRVMAYVWPE
jgi:hypothetical protein